MRRVAGLLLTGGASARMGVTKAELRVGGQRLADRAAVALCAVCDPVLEIGPGYTGLASMTEPEPGRGPLAALAAGAAALQERGYDGPLLLLAVDLAFVDTALLELLAEREPPDATVVPDAAGVPQTLCARYGTRAQADAVALVASGARSLRALLDRTPWSPVAEADWRAVAPAHALDDADTPADVERLGLEWPG